MGNKILESAVVSRLPTVKAPPSKLKTIANMRSKRIWADNLKFQKNLENIPKTAKDSGNNTSIVLVDDDQTSRYSMRSIGRQLNFNVYSAGSFAQALRTFDIRPDIGVVILRVSNNPQQFEKMLRVLKDQHPNVSIVALADIENVRWVLDLVSKGYVFRYLSESFDKTDFEKVILSATKRYRMMHKIEELRNQTDSDEFLSISKLDKLKLFLSKSA